MYEVLGGTPLDYPGFLNALLFLNVLFYKQSKPVVGYWVNHPHYWALTLFQM